MHCALVTIILVFLARMRKRILSAGVYLKGEGYKNSTKLKQPLIHLKQPELLYNEPLLIDVTG